MLPGPKVTAKIFRNPLRHLFRANKFVRVLYLTIDSKVFESCLNKLERKREGREEEERWKRERGIEREKGREKGRGRGEEGKIKREERTVEIAGESERGREKGREIKSQTVLFS